MVDLVKQWKEAARRDDLFDHMVPSDVRQLIGEIERQRAALKAAPDWPATDKEYMKWFCGLRHDALRSVCDAAQEVSENAQD